MTEQADIQQKHPKRFLRYAGLGLLCIPLLYIGATKVDIAAVGQALLHVSLWWAAFSLMLMCASMITRAGAWTYLLRSALPGEEVKHGDSVNAVCIGSLFGTFLPARLGEVPRLMVVSRRIKSHGETSETVAPTIAGTMVAQTMLNIAILCVLYLISMKSLEALHLHHTWLVWAIPTALVAILLGVIYAARRSTWLASRKIGRSILHGLEGVQQGLQSLRSMNKAVKATGLQFSAWGMQWLACYALLVAFHMNTGSAMLAAAGILLAINLAGAIPATPSNVGVFQLACIGVLTSLYGITSADALGYGVLLQALEISTGIILGLPALFLEQRRMNRVVNA